MMLLDHKLLAWLLAFSVLAIIFGMEATSYGYRLALRQRPGSSTWLALGTTGLVGGLIVWTAYGLDLFLR